MIRVRQRQVVSIDRTAFDAAACGDELGKTAEASVRCVSHLERAALVPGSSKGCGQPWTGRAFEIPIRGLCARDAGFVNGATWDINGDLFMR